MEHIDDLQAKLQEECGFVLPRFCYCQDYQYFVVDKTVDYAVALVGVVNKNQLHGEDLSYFEYNICVQEHLY